MFNRKNQILITNLKLKNKNQFAGLPNFNLITYFTVYLLIGIAISILINQLSGENNFILTTSCYLIAFIIISMLPRLFLASVNSFDNNCLYQARFGKLKKININDLNYSQKKTTTTIHGPGLAKTIVLDPKIAEKLVKKIDLYHHKG